MQQLRVKSAKLVSLADKNPPLLDALILPFEKVSGSIFALIRVLGPHTDERIQIKDIVFEHLERLHAGADEQMNIPRRFEQIVQAINETLFSTVEQHQKVPMSDFHAIIGVRVKNQLYFTGVGTLSALFMHRTAQQRYVIYELDKQLREEQSWAKPFVTVLDGELHPGDIFYLATRANQREISTEDMQDILVTLPPPGALKRIQQHIHRDNSYGAVCLQVTDKEPESRAKKVNPLSSLQELSATQDQTADLLGEQKPHIWTAISAAVKPLLDRLSSPGKQGGIVILKRILKAILQALLLAVKHIVVAGKAITTLAKRLYARTKSTDGETKRFTLPTLQLKHAYIALGGVAVVTLLISGIFIAKAIGGNGVDVDAYQLTLLQAEEKKSAAAASLIYKDTEQATSLAEEAIALLASLPLTDDEALLEQRALLEKGLEEVQNEIRGVNEVTSANLGNLTTVITGTPVALEIAAGTLYAVSVNNEIATYRELDGSWNKLETTLGSVGSPRIAAVEEANLLMIDQEKRLTRMNPSTATVNPITSGTPGLESVEDIATYNGNLYVLTNAGSQIVRMRPQVGVYDAGTIWITSTLHTLANLRSLAIDGDIYVLTDANVLKFSSGNQQAFTLAPVEPPLTNATKIWTDQTSTYLYILEPTSNRIAVFNKTGDLVKQYFSEEFASAIDFTVQETKNSIVVLTPTQALTFPADHLLQ